MTLPTTLTRTQPLLFLIEKLADYTLKKEEALDFILYILGWASEVQSKDIDIQFTWHSKLHILHVHISGKEFWIYRSPKIWQSGYQGFSLDPQMIFRISGDPSS